MKFVRDIYCRQRMPLLGAFSCRPTVASLRNHVLHACRYWYCGCHSQDTAVGRDRTHYSFSSIRAVSRVWSLNSNYYKIKKRQLWDRGFHRNSSLQAAWDNSILYEAKQGCGVVSCTTFGMRAEPKYSYSYDIILYVCTWGLLLLIFHRNTYFHFFSRYVGTW